MGFHVSWIASRGKAVDAIHAGLRVRATPGREELPESEITGALLPSGWYLVFFNDVPPEMEDRALERLSMDCELLAFVVEETSMVSLAQGYDKGKRCWALMHDPDKGPAHLEVEGVPPAALPAVRARVADGFDVPAAVSKELTGFRYDEDLGGAQDAFTVLERVGRWRTVLDILTARNK